jgi:hypothetical protein
VKPPCTTSVPTCMPTYHCMTRRPACPSFTVLSLMLSICAGCVADQRVLDTQSVSNAISLKSLCGPESASAMHTGGAPPHARACRYLTDTIDDVDLLFVIDNSHSMEEEQLRMPTQFRRLVQALTSGDRDGDGKQDFAPVQSLHLGVVSSDMGLPGIEKVDKCSGLGDDGILLHSPSTGIEDCKADYPAFISATPGDADKATQAADDFSCMATLGTDGCGFEQQLEAGLKALWPMNDPTPMKNGMNRVRFVTTPDGKGEFGHGDTDNGDFLRNDPGSILGVIVLSDEDDGSSSKMDHFAPKQFLDAHDPRYDEPLNLRTYYHPDELFPTTRYVLGFKALRPEAPERVVFGAIVGVPPELAGADAVANIATDASAREDFYTALLDDPHMQEVVDDDTATVPGQGALRPSCKTLDSDGKPTGKAYPPRRIVQVAQGFGENGFVQSICSDDFDPAIDALVDRIGARIDPSCLDSERRRDEDGLIASCEVLWVLPLAGEAGSENAQACSDVGDFLAPAGASYGLPDHLASRVCKMRQLPIASADDPHATPQKAGWYYDDFSDSADLCVRSHSRIALTESVKAPEGVRVILDCY